MNKNKYNRDCKLKIGEYFFRVCSFKRMWSQDDLEKYLKMLKIHLYVDYKTGWNTVHEDHPILDELSSNIGLLKSGKVNEFLGLEFMEYGETISSLKLNMILHFVYKKNNKGRVNVQKLIKRYTK